MEMEERTYEELVREVAETNSRKFYWIGKCTEAEAKITTLEREIKRLKDELAEAHCDLEESREDVWREASKTQYYRGMSDMAQYVFDKTMAKAE